MEYKIALAVESDWEEVLGLYRSLIGRDGCTWDVDYPTAENVREDIRKQSLYIIRDGGAVIAAAAAGRMRIWLKSAASVRRSAGPASCPELRLTAPVRIVGSRRS